MFSACSNHRKGDSVKTTERDFVLSQYLKELPPYADFVYTQEDSLLFGFTKGATDYDTSWTLLISKSDNVILCRYIQLLPYTVTGFDSYLDESTKLLYYDGFQFEIDKSRLDSLVSLSGLDKYVADDSIPYTGCPHCPRYTAYYKSKLIVNSKKDNRYLTQLDSIFQKEVINSLFDKKHNPPLRLQK